MCALDFFSHFFVLFVKERKQLLLEIKIGTFFDPNFFLFLSERRFSASHAPFNYLATKRKVRLRIGHSGINLNFPFFLPSGILSFKWIMISLLFE